MILYAGAAYTEIHLGGRYHARSSGKAPLDVLFLVQRAKKSHYTEECLYTEAAYKAGGVSDLLLALLAVNYPP